MISKAKSIEILQRQNELIAGVILVPMPSAEFSKWKRDTEIAIERIFGSETRHIKDFKAVNYSVQFLGNSYTPQQMEEIRQRRYKEGLLIASAILLSLVQEVEEYHEESQGSLIGQDLDQGRDVINSLKSKLQACEMLLARYETRFHDQLIATFNESELKSLCFSLNIDYEILSGDNKGDKARELILHCRRHNCTAELLERCRELRPHLPW